MSLAADRAEIAEALRVVPGLTVLESIPTATGAATGVSWVNFPGLSRPDGYWVIEWNIFVILGPVNDVANAIRHMQEWVDPIADALLPVGCVVSIQPIEIDIDGGGRAALHVVMRREAD